MSSSGLKLVSLLMVFGVCSYDNQFMQIGIRFILNLLILTYFILGVFYRQIFRLSKGYLFVLLLILIFCLLGLYSAFNSVIFLKSLFKVYELCVLIALCYFLTSRKNFDLISCFNFSFLGTLAISITSDFLFGTPYLFEIKGLIPLINANTVGFMAGLMVLINLPKGNKTIIGIASILLFLSGSMTSLILTIFMAIFLLLSIQKFIILSLSFLILAFFSLDFLVSGEDIETVMLFSGRMLLWERIFDIYVSEFNFFEGVGLGAGRELNSQFYGGVAKSFHNAYLEVLISLGWLGLLTFIWILLYVVYAVRKNLRNYRGIEMILLLYVIVRAFTSSNLTFVSIDSLIFWSAYFYSCRKLYFRRDLITKDKYKQQGESVSSNNYTTPKVLP